MRKSFTAVVLVVGMALGSVLTMVLNPVGAASALVGANTTKGSHESVLQQALDALVGKGTITQAQADDVTNEVQSDRQARYAKLPALRQGRLRGGGRRAQDGPQGPAPGAGLRQVHRPGGDAKGVNPSTLASQITAGLEKAINARVSGHKVAQAVRHDDGAEPADPGQHVPEPHLGRAQGRQVVGQAGREARRLVDHLGLDHDGPRTTGH